MLDNSELKCKHCDAVTPHTAMNYNPLLYRCTYCEEHQEAQLFTKNMYGETVRCSYVERFDKETIIVKVEEGKYQGTYFKLETEIFLNPSNE